MRRPREKSIRHPKSPIPNVEKSQKITLSNFFKQIKLDEIKYIQILEKLLSNRLSDSPQKHIHKYLEEDEYSYLQYFIYTLATFKFKFKDIYLLLWELIAESTIKKFTYKYNNHQPLLQSPVRINLYMDEENDLQNKLDIYVEKSTLKYLDEKKHQKRWDELIEGFVSQKISITHLDTDEVVSTKELLQLKKRNFKK